MSTRVVLFVALFVFALGGFTIAQDNANSDLLQLSFNSPDEDPGLPDTVRIVPASYPLGTTEFAVEVSLWNDEELGGFNLPITWDSPDIVCDSVSFTGTRVDYVMNKLYSIDNANRRLQAGIVIFFESNVPPGDGLIYRAHFSVNPGAADQQIFFDSTFYPPAGNFNLVTGAGLTFVPQMSPNIITYGNPPTDPTISLDPTSFAFTATEGDVNPADQVLTITNTGVGTLNWTASNNSAWLTLDPTSGSGDGSTTLSVDITGLTAGVYYDTVTVSDPSATNDPQKAEVMLTVEEPPPTISLDPVSFAYTIFEGETLPDDQLDITNTGGGALNWTAGNLSGWLTLDPTSGSGDATVTLSFDVSGLAAGVYYDTITVSDPAATNNPQKATVQLTVNIPPPVIVLSPTSFTYVITEGDALANDQLSITNGGGGDLNWTASNLSGWLTLDPTSGVGDGSVTMSFDVAALTAGTYLDTITVSDPAATNNPQKAAVMLTVNPPPPTISLDPASFSYAITEGNGLPDDQLTISNVGGSVLNWTAANLSGWLSLNPTSGSGDGTVTLSFDVAALTPGTYYDTITVSDPAATNSPQEAPVMLTVTATPIPIISANPSAFTFNATEGGANPPAQVLRIDNIGDGTLDWTAAVDAGWLNVDPTTGSDGDSSAVTVDMTGLTPGTYVDTITITDPLASNSPVYVPVTFNIEALPVIVLSPTSFTYVITQGDALGNDQLSITNGGGGELNWTVSNLSGWLTLDPTSGVGDGSVTMSFDVAALTAGTYYDTITVTDPTASNSPQEAPVMLTVNPPPPTISLDPGSFSYAVTEGNSLPDDQLTISNVGGSVLNWTAANLSSWLSLNPTSGSGDGVVTLSFDVAALTPGTYYDTITVSDPAATNSPQEAPVMLTVTATPIPTISASPSAFTFNATEGGANPPAQTLRIDNIGDGTLDWTATVGAGWLNVDPTTGSDGDSSAVTVDMTGLAPGTYVDTITITDPLASNSPVYVPVTFNIEALPLISLDPTSFAYVITEGDALPNDQLSIINAGGGELNWAASSLSGWLTLDPTSGVGDGSVTMSFDVAALTAGTYHDTITVTDPTASNSPQTVPVMLTINPPAPSIALDPTLITLFAYEDESIPDFAIDVTNTGGGVLEWTATYQTGWVTVNPTSGTGDGTITVSFDITGVPPGDYVDTVFVDDPAALNTPQYTVINLTVYETDHVEVAVVSAFAGEQVEVAVDYTNATPTGQFTLPLSFVNTDVVCDSVSFQGTRMVAPDESLVTIDNAAGTIEIFGFSIGGPILPAGSGPIARMFFTVAGGAPAQFVPIDTTFIAPDGAFEFTYYMAGPKTTLFTAGGIDISDTPCFDFPTDTVAFEFNLGGVVPSISFPITNSCGGVLEWTVTDEADWLYLTPTSGTQFDEVTFNIDTVGMSPGSYVTTATFESNGLGTPYVVVVTLNLIGVPIISLEPEVIDFGQVCSGDLVDSSFDIVNTGSAVLNWHAETIEAVILSDYSGTAPWTVFFTINTEFLEYGYNELEVVVTGESAINSPQVLTLKLFVVNCDECTFDIADVDGAQGIPVGVPIYSGGVADVAGLQFNIAYDMTKVTADSITSTYMEGPTIGIANGEMHYVWTEIYFPITVPAGEAIMTLWVTPIGDIGAENCFTWIGENEITDPYGIPYEGVVYCGGCLTVISPFFSISGSIGYYDFVRPVPDVTVDLTGDALASTATDEHGDYLFADLSAGSYMIEPSRDENDPGVSIADAIKIERHLAFVEEFDSPFKMIAADVNLSGNVSVADVVKIERFLAELEDLPSGHWTFVDADFEINMSNWFEAPHYIDALISDKDLDLLDFVAVRMGDVNNTWSLPASSKAMAADVELTIPDLIAAPSDDIDVPIIVANFTAVAGIEIHVSYDMAGVTVDSITSAVIPDPTVNAVNGRVHIIWGDFTSPLTLADGETLAVIHFHILPTALGDLPLEFMGNCELTDDIGDPYPLGLTNGSLLVDPLDVDDETTNLPTAFELKQNYPNPFNPSTTISYSVDKSMSLVLEIYNISGQVVERIDLGRKTAGTYEYNFSGENLASGLYTYRLIGEGVSEARQMMLVK